VAIICAQQAALSLGGNIGDVTGSFVETIRRFAETPGVALRRESSIYATPPWGKIDQPSFLNMAVIVETSLTPRALLELCLKVEQDMGRERKERWGPRTLDIDILTYAELVIDEPDLKLPHPRLVERAFVLAPLAEISPELRIGGLEVAQLLTRVDCQGVEIDAHATRRLHAEFRSIGKRGGGSPSD
jgi:2-amino-4-hydroxy-6-hydroxymethyldihydropteridine diphosphokinase